MCGFFRDFHHHNIVVWALALALSPIAPAFADGLLADRCEYTLHREDELQVVNYIKQLNGLYLNAQITPAEKSRRMNARIAELKQAVPKPSADPNFQWYFNNNQIPGRPFSHIVGGVDLGNVVGTKSKEPETNRQTERLWELHFMRRRILNVMPELEPGVLGLSAPTSPSLINLGQSGSLLNEAPKQRYNPLTGKTEAVPPAQIYLRPDEAAQDGVNGLIYGGKKFPTRGLKEQFKLVNAEIDQVMKRLRTLRELDIKALINLQNYLQIKELSQTLVLNRIMGLGLSAADKQALAKYEVSYEKMKLVLYSMTHNQRAYYDRISREGVTEEDRKNFSKYGLTATQLATVQAALSTSQILAYQKILNKTLRPQDRVAIKQLQLTDEQVNSFLGDLAPREKPYFLAITAAGSVYSPSKGWDHGKLRVNAYTLQKNPRLLSAIGLFINEMALKELSNPRREVAFPIDNYMFLPPLHTTKSGGAITVMTRAQYDKRVAAAQNRFQIEAGEFIQASAQTFGVFDLLVHGTNQGVAWLRRILTLGFVGEVEVGHDGKLPAEINHASSMEGMQNTVQELRRLGVAPQYLDYYLEAVNQARRIDKNNFENVVNIMNNAMLALKVAPAIPLIIYFVGLAAAAWAGGLAAAAAIAVGAEVMSTAATVAFVAAVNASLVLAILPSVFGLVGNVVKAAISSGRGEGGFWCQFRDGVIPALSDGIITGAKFAFLPAVAPLLGVGVGIFAAVEIAAGVVVVVDMAIFVGFLIYQGVGVSSAWAECGHQRSIAGKMADDHESQNLINRQTTIAWQTCSQAGLDTAFAIVTAAQVKVAGKKIIEAAGKPEWISERRAGVSSAQDLTPQKSAGKILTEDAFPTLGAWTAGLGSLVKSFGKSPAPKTPVTPGAPSTGPPAPANGTTPPPANGTTPPPANGTTPPPANGTTPPPNGVPAEGSGAGQAVGTSAPLANAPVVEPPVSTAPQSSEPPSRPPSRSEKRDAADQARSEEIREQVAENLRQGKPIDDIVDPKTGKPVTKSNDPIVKGAIADAMWDATGLPKPKVSIIERMFSKDGNTRSQMRALMKRFKVNRLNVVQLKQFVDTLVEITNPELKGDGQFMLSLFLREGIVKTLEDFNLIPRQAKGPLGLVQRSMRAVREAQVKNRSQAERIGGGAIQFLQVAINTFVNVKVAMRIPKIQLLRMIRLSADEEKKFREMTFDEKGDFSYEGFKKAIEEFHDTRASLKVGGKTIIDLQTLDTWLKGAYHAVNVASYAYLLVMIHDVVMGFDQSEAFDVESPDFKFQADAADAYISRDLYLRDQFQGFLMTFGRRSWPDPRRKDNPQHAISDQRILDGLLARLNRMADELEDIKYKDDPKRPPSPDPVKLKNDGEQVYLKTLEEFRVAFPQRR